MVDADSAVDAKVKAAEQVIVTEVAGAYGESIAVGINLYRSPGYVGAIPDKEIGGNGVEADADLTLTVTTVPRIVVPAVTPAEESALALLNSEVMSAIHESVTEGTSTEVVDVQLSAGVPSIEAYSGGHGEAVGIGILLVFCDYSMVMGNNPVRGSGDLTATISATENPGDPALAEGGGMGLGVGILVSASRGVEVSHNTYVNGEGTAMVSVGAQVGGTATTTGGNAMACGGGDGIGIGILLTGCSAFLNEAEGLAEGQMWDDRPVIAKNSVIAVGDAETGVSAKNLVISQDSCACGEALGLALGIAAVWYPCILIQDNMIEADGDADATVYAEAIHSYDPVSNGRAAGIGIGIVTVFGCYADIIGNDTMGTGDAYADVDSWERSKELEAEAGGGSLGLGKGILVFFSGGTDIHANTATGIGTAEANVKADSDMPLYFADADGMAAGIGSGIAVVACSCAWVTECNVAAGEGDACVCVEADADFGDADSCGLAANIDIMFACFNEGAVNYNSMVDAEYVGVGDSDGPVKEFDAGLYVIGHHLDARFNWWNDVTGPSGMRHGKGEPLIYEGCDGVAVIPWLYIDHQTAMADQTGYFVYPNFLEKGLNTLSTPLGLETSVVPSANWSDIMSNSCMSTDDYDYILKWDSAAQLWDTVALSDTLKPLDAWYIYMYNPGKVYLMVNSDSSNADAMPTRNLVVPDGGGWALISANPPYEEFGLPAMSVDEALASIELTPAGLPGYTQVISPITNSQDPWIYVPGMDAPEMIGFRGYWVWMENTDILAGFGFTPIWVGPF
jgi:hypothetical protein